jgi:protein-tyrosine phosphatase
VSRKLIRNGFDLMKPRISVLFVCMGNICRSPTAAGVFHQHVGRAGLSDLVLIDSAGTHGYHIGDPPDARSRAAAARRRYDLSRLRARQVIRQDLEIFDYVLAMDRENLAFLEQLSPPAHRGKAHLFLQYATATALREVPDPYYGDGAGFDLVLDLVEDASRGLLGHIRGRLEAVDTYGKA